MVKLYIIVKVNERSIARVWEGLPIDGIIVRLQDLVCPSSLNFNKTFYEIEAAGGIHSFLGFNGKIILSLIMKDVLLPRLTLEMYDEAVKTLKPDFYTTPDCEAYEKEFMRSLSEITRCSLETYKLLKLCNCSKPIGQIKGASRFQVLLHLRLLRMMGIRDFIFHMSDFSRHGSPDKMNIAKGYACLIKKRADSLILYGMGCQKRLIEFSFVDAYASLNYLIKALKGRRYNGVNETAYSGGYSTAVVRHNLVQMLRNVKSINAQKKLVEGGIFQWEAAQEAPGLFTQEAAQPITIH